MSIPSKERGCKGKVKFGDNYHHQVDILALRHVKQYGVYDCPHCDGHHLTTKLKNKDKYTKQLVYITP